VITVTGDERYLADYLYRESMIQLPENLHRFLRCTAVLDQLCGPLCDAVLESSGAADQLRRLEASNAFLVPLDRRREWYRYHGLFREFLLGELRRIEPDVVAKLHLRAADWYQANGSPVLALEHLLNTSERDRAAQLVAELAVPTYDAGQVSTVQRWLGALGNRDIEGYPPLAVLAGWASALTGDTIAAERWAAVAEAASFDSAPGDGSTSFESARAMLRAIMCASGPEPMLADATFAVAHEPVWSRWRRTALMELGEAHLLIGDREAARAAFVESCGRSQVIDDTSSAVSEAELALLAMDAGDWQEAADRVTRALATSNRDIATTQVSDLCLRGPAGPAVVTSMVRVPTRGRRARTSATHAVPFVAVRLRPHPATAYSPSRAEDGSPPSTRSTTS
jgi:LuxR family maltose regulon positive regulatory protein